MTTPTDAKTAEPATLSTALQFLIPAALGAFIFLWPISTNKGITVTFGMMTAKLKLMFQDGWDEALLLVVTIATLGSIALKWSNVSPARNSLTVQCFEASAGAILLRVLGLFVVACVYFEVGPSLVRLPDTGQTVVYDIGINVLIIYLLGLALMPLLTSFGLMEFVGTLCQPVFHLLFRIPGRAAIDALTSVVSASAIGLLVTLSEYNKGTYSTREASVIACSFSIVSIPFSLLITQVAGIEDLFFPWYLSVIFTCLVCALLIARLPPLSTLPNNYRTAQPQPQPQPKPQPKPKPESSKPLPKISALRSAWRAAITASAVAPTPKAYVRNWFRDFLKFSLSVIGPSVAIATLASIFVFHTPAFDAVISPLSWLLGVLNVSEASTVAPGLIAGFADQFVPALIAAELTGTYWKFVLAGLSVAQLVFMSEFGLLVLRSNLPLGLKELALVFVLRSLISLPLLMVFAWFFTN